MRAHGCDGPFAHVCETRGARGSWLRGPVNVAAAHIVVGTEVFRDAGRFRVNFLRACP